MVKLGFKQSYVEKLDDQISNELCQDEDANEEVIFRYLVSFSSRRKIS
jgi:hypothetical protein